VRARDLGIVIGTGRPGPLDAITDVAGVSVGHETLIEGDRSTRSSTRRSRRPRKLVNALVAAETMTGFHQTVHRLDHDLLVEVMGRAGRLAR
jgi:hypothetical protein